MFHSVFQIFKPGIGPSSSHTMGPMTAARAFRSLLKAAPTGSNKGSDAMRLQCTLYGSLACTGKGHATDRAVTLGLLGFQPDNVDTDEANDALQRLTNDQHITIAGIGRFAFDPDTDIIFDLDRMDFPHPNTLVLEAVTSKGRTVISEHYCSVGGGFVVTAKELSDPTTSEEQSGLTAAAQTDSVPFVFKTMEDLLSLGQRHDLKIVDIARRNELALMDEREVHRRLDNLSRIMDRSIERGLSAEGTLPGGLKVQRRARKLHQSLLAEWEKNTVRPHAVNDWLCTYAMAVNEENASGHQIVTAPTNGAAGVVPAVLRYLKEHMSCPDLEKSRDFLLVSATVGSIIKQGASISGAEVGCQGEVGSASAMAAAGLCAVLGGTNAQIENAAEIALEHHLGMTCDPVMGLVQVPCIERNGFGAIKAVAAASLALHGDGTHIMPLDNCIEAMRETGIDMNSKYKETSCGGLAVNLPEC